MIQSSSVIDPTHVLNEILTLIVAVAVIWAAIQGFRHLGSDPGAGVPWFALSAAILVVGIWYLDGVLTGVGVLLILLALLAGYGAIRLRSIPCLVTGVAAAAVGVVFVSGLWAPVLHGASRLLGV